MHKENCKNDDLDDLICTGFGVLARLANQVPTPAPYSTQRHEIDADLFVLLLRRKQVTIEVCVFVSDGITVCM